MKITLPLGLLALALAQPLALMADSHMIPLSEEQASHLGVITAAPQPVSGIPLAQAPGGVVLPPAQGFAVTRDQLHDCVSWLANEGLVSRAVSVLTSIVALSTDGWDVFIGNKPHPGVARPGAE